jgi:peptide/nickel transport system ATP-binding protein
MSLVEVRDLRVELGAGGPDIVDGISFAVDSGEVLGLVGESGSGKTTVGLAVLAHARRGARIASGKVMVDGQDVLSAAPAELRGLRGGTISYVAQDPAAALNPALRLRRQLLETLVAHTPGWKEDQRLARVQEVLEQVGLPSDDEFLHRYPHQISGGQQQRLAIAIAFVCRPRVIVCDEPTTGLDVTTQARVLRTLRELCTAHSVAAIYVSHDLAVVAEIADRVLVMYAGRLAELGDRGQVFASPSHPYTRRLMGAIPSISKRLVLEPIPGRAPAPGDRPAGCFFAPRCELALDACREGEPPRLEVGRGHYAGCLRANELAGGAYERSAVAVGEVGNGGKPILSAAGIDVTYGSRQILHGVSLEVKARECVALVGESGSGKTTLSRALVGLVAPSAGELTFQGQALASDVRRRPAETRQALQYIFQSPFNSLNPRRPVGAIVAAPLEHFFGVRGAEARQRAEEALDMVSLSPVVADQYPDQLSGGERQRVAIARALICRPQVLICDEITSALDVSVQASIIRLLQRLREEEDLSLLFVTHNLPLVRSIADRVAVMSAGRIVERGPLESVLDHPQQPYTRGLIADTPDPVAVA